MSDARTDATPEPRGLLQTKPPSTMSQEELDALTGLIVQALKSVYDPEIPADIYELGLIYNVDIDDARMVTIEMTLTAPACPSAQELPVQVQEAVMSVPGVTDCEVETVWDPPWDPSRMTEEARLQLNMY